MKSGIFLNITSISDFVKQSENITWNIGLRVEIDGLKGSFNDRRKWEIMKWKQ
jgi:hypothetical protein